MKKYLLALMIGCWINPAAAGFDVIALGVNGGVEEGNLTSYLVRSDDQKLYLGLDAGSVLPGIRKALEKGSFPGVTAENATPLTPQGAVFRNLIGGYFISHGHLDHLAGLIISSPEDTKSRFTAPPTLSAHCVSITSMVASGRISRIPAAACASARTA